MALGTLDLLFRLVVLICIPTVVSVGSLYIFNDLGDIWYIFASIMAFAIGFFVINLVMKYWIYANPEADTNQSQMVRFMIIFTLNLAINTELVYLLVTYASVELFIAQTVTAVIIAFESYYAYRSLVFKDGAKKVSVADVIRSAPIIADPDSSNN